MSNRFLLFGETPFERYALERFSFIASGIERMSDTEILMYKEDFGALVSKVISAYLFPDVNISFENKMVDLVAKRGATGRRYFAEYSLVVTGEPYCLGLIPCRPGRNKFRLPVELKENFLSFEIDTCYHSEELPPEITSAIRVEYDRIKEYITASLDDLNQTILYYNAEMEKFVVPLLADKLRKAERCWKIREALNFK